VTNQARFLQTLTAIGNEIYVPIKDIASVHYFFENKLYHIEIHMRSEDFFEELYEDALKAENRVLKIQKIIGAE
jgi:hypothetical protein